MNTMTRCMCVFHWFAAAFVYSVREAVGFLEMYMTILFFWRVVEWSVYPTSKREEMAW